MWIRGRRVKNNRERRQESCQGEESTIVTTFTFPTFTQLELRETFYISSFCTMGNNNDHVS